MVSPGDTVRLKWTGSKSLPKWLGGRWAKVIKITRSGKIEVQPHEDDKTRVITIDNIFT